MTTFVFSSDQYANFFDDNSASRFKTRLLQRTVFDKDANITLRHIRVPPLKVATLAHIYCSAVDVVQVGARAKPLLQIVALDQSDTAQSYTISAPIRRRLACNELEEVKFTIRDASDREIPFEKEAVTTVLVQIQ